MPGGAGPHRRGARTPLPDTLPARPAARTAAGTARWAPSARPTPRTRPHCCRRHSSQSSPLSGTLSAPGSPEPSAGHWTAQGLGAEGGRGAWEPRSVARAGGDSCALALCRPASGPATREEVGVSRRSWSLAVVLAHLTPLAQESWIQSKETQNPKKWVCPQTHHFTISSTSRDQEINNKVTRVWQPQAWPPPTWGFPSSG